MRIHELTISRFKGLDVQLRWAPVVVLFGANDAGKTNVLEAVEQATTLEPTHLRAEPLAEPADYKLSARIELEGLERTDGDADVLAGLLQVRHLPPMFPRRSEDGEVLDADAADRAPPDGIHMGRHPAALLAWPPHPSDLGREMFWIGCVGEESVGLREIGTLAEVKAQLRERAIDHARSRARGEHDLLGRGEEFRFDWRRARPAFIRLLGACLDSRWLRFSESAGVTWLTPRTEDCDGKLVDAARHLADIVGDEPPVVGPFARQLIEAGEQQVFLRIGEGHGFLPWQMVWPSASPARLAELAGSVAEFVRWSVRVEGVLQRRRLPADPWLEVGEEGSVRVSDAVERVCERLSEQASEIAPSFVRERYTLAVEPLSPADWRRLGNRLLRVVARPRGTDESFDFSVLGSGYAIWSIVAVEEAVRQLQEQLLSDETLGEQGLLLDPDEVDEMGEPLHPPRAGLQATLYVIDEPERHLHPRAQEEVAVWIAERVERGANVLLATHALPFLSIPTEDVEYCLVGRDASRTTRSRSISDDVWGLLGRAPDFVPVASRAQLIQLLRGLLIVEGAHDEMVLRHFFGPELAKARIELLAARGARGVSALIDAELVAMLERPLAILFDDIRLEMVTSSERPPGREIAARALWNLLRNWPAERPQPTVVSFDLPDIFCALPEQCVERVAGSMGGRFPGWDQVIESFRAEKSGVGFKSFFFKHCGLSVRSNPDAFLQDVLEVCRSRPCQQLELAVNHAIAAIQGTRTA